MVPSRLAEALPPASVGAAVEATKVCEGSLKQRLADPEALLLPHHARGELPASHPRVWATRGVWPQVAKLLLKCDIANVVPCPEVARVDDREVLHGCFGVGKPGFPRGSGPQRFVVNMPVLNAILEVINGDMPMLPMVNSWHMVFLEGNQVCFLSSEDTKCAFYLFKLPRKWYRWLCFSISL